MTPARDPKQRIDTYLGERCPPRHPLKCFAKRPPVNVRFTPNHVFLMISKITDLDNLKGIRISTNVFFIKKVYLRKNIKYLYKNVITITNKSKNTIQIISKHNKILELFSVKKLNSILKEKPVIQPGKKITLNLATTHKKLIRYLHVIRMGDDGLLWDGWDNRWDDGSDDPFCELPWLPW